MNVAQNCPYCGEFQEHIWHHIYFEHPEEYRRDVEPIVLEDFRCMMPAD